MEHYFIDNCLPKQTQMRPPPPTEDDNEALQESAYITDYPDQVSVDQSDMNPSWTVTEASPSLTPTGQNEDDYANLPFDPIGQTLTVRRPAHTSTPVFPLTHLTYAHPVSDSTRRSQSLGTKPTIVVTRSTHPDSSERISVIKSTRDQSETASSSWLIRHCGKFCFQFWIAFVTLIVAIRAIIVRMGFICFTCTAIVTVVTEKRDNRFWLLCITIIPLLIDLILAIKGQMERKLSGSVISKWFSLCNFAYLICACPPIWIIELHHMDQVNNATAIMQIMVNQTTPGPTTPSWLPAVQRRLPQNESMMIMGADIENYIRSGDFYFGDWSTRLTRVRRSTVELEYIMQMALQKNFPLKERIRILEQLLLLSVIVGRWLMPREGLTRDQLSQLLLINIGTAADILELFEAFNEQVVRENDLLRTVILCLWQASLIQFCFNKTALREILNDKASRKLTGSIHSSRSIGDQPHLGSIDILTPAFPKPITEQPQAIQPHGTTGCCACCQCRRRSRIASVDEIQSTQVEDNNYTCCVDCPCPNAFSFLCKERPCLCCETELWAIGMSLMLQDLPFLVLRLTLIIYFNVRSYSNVFFTCKNTLLIMLQLFRSIVIVVEAYERSKDPVHSDVESQQNSAR